jgi:hypothetical protein
MLGPSGNPRVENLFVVVGFLERHEGVRFQLNTVSVDLFCSFCSAQKSGTGNGKNPHELCANFHRCPAVSLRQRMIIPAE